MFLVIFFVGGLAIYYLNLMSENSRNAERIVSEITTRINTIDNNFLEVEKSISEQYYPETGGFIINLDSASYRSSLNEFYREFRKLGTGAQQYPRLKPAYQAIEDIYQNTLTESNGDYVYDVKKILYSIERVNSKLSIMSEAHEEIVKDLFTETAETTDKVINYMIVSGGLAVLIGLVILFGFPSYIGKPLQEVTNAISDFKNKNYRRRVNFRKDDEFGVLANSFNQMAEHIEKLESEQRERIATEETKSKIILDNLREAVLITDTKKNILFINRKLESLLSIPKEDLLGKYAPDIAIDNTLLRKMISSLGKKSNAGGLVSHEIEGKKRYYEKEILKISMPDNDTDVAKEAGNKIAGNVIILKDITDFQQKDIAKTNLISTISHELKTPISSIKMSTQLLFDKRIGNINEEQFALVEDIAEDCNRLLRITKELVDMANMESGKIKMSISSVSAKDFVTKAVDSVMFQADVKNITINNELVDSSIKVKADIEKSNLVMVNLLTNAIKYSDVGGEINIAVNKIDKDYVFSVRDHGEGIEKQHHKKIFNRYYQVEKKEYDVKKTGSGLGLAITKEFVEEQNGKLWVESEPGEGTIFYFSLPADTSETKSDVSIDDFFVMKKGSEDK
jgi:signal transduction histidine kinase